MKAPSLLLFLFLCCLFPRITFSQCQTASPPPACTGTEPLVTDNETLNTGTTKWYYGPGVTFNDLTLKGGTLVVCSELIINRFYMDSGTIYIHPGARLVITSGIGSGIIFRGNCAIYNYGTCEIQRNLSLDPGATAGRPNIVINATAASVFKMSNQYLVINNPFSWFVNNGHSEFWGIINDPQSVAGSVCLGNGSITTMAVLINKIANTYAVPTGNACVYVHQFSQFFGPLTNASGLLACLSSSHRSDAGCIPHGCTPNNWGAAQVFTNCNSCSAIISLAIGFTGFNVSLNTQSKAALGWQMNTAIPNGVFRIMRSGDALHYETIDSIVVNNGHSSFFHFIDKQPLQGNNFYMIKYIGPGGRSSSSKIVQLYAENKNGISIYPIPFDNSFSIHYKAGESPEKILLTDITGRTIRTRYIIKESSRRVEMMVLDNLEPGVYIVHLQTKKNYIAQTILRK
jgi:hypothetical protein